MRHYAFLALLGFAIICLVDALSGTIAYLYIGTHEADIAVCMVAGIVVGIFFHFLHGVHEPHKWLVNEGVFGLPPLMVVLYPSLAILVALVWYQAKVAPYPPNRTFFWALGLVATAQALGALAVWFVTIRGTRWERMVSRR